MAGLRIGRPATPTGRRTDAGRRSGGLDRRTRAIGLSLALGGLMVVVDTTVTAVAVPAIVAGLDVPLPAAQWATIAYLLGLVSVIPLAARSMDRFGARRVYLVALLVFTVFSALVGVAWDMVSLAVFRFLQGLGGGLLNPVAMAIALRAAPRDARGRLMSLLVLPLVIGPVLGPLLAGWLIDVASWRWIFLINVPVGVLALAVCARVLPTVSAPPPSAVESAPGGAARRPVDWAGLVLLSGGAVLAVLGGTLLEQPLGTMFVAGLGLLAAGAGMLAVFVRRARGQADPLIDLRLTRHRPVRTGLGVLNTFGPAYFGSMTVLPLFVVGVRGDPAALIGLLTLPSALTVGLVAQVATRLVDRIPGRWIIRTGTALGAAGGAGLLTACVTDAGYPWIVAASVLLSAGSGATLMPAMTLSLRDLDHAETPQGTTLFALVQQLSSAAGGAVVAITLSMAVSARLPDGVAGMLALGPEARAALRPELATAVGTAYLIPMILLVLSCLIAFRRPRAVPS
ncbi:MDR family MFS transporter [Actinoplanes utahensis]|nr:MFS transporter [Actinoplanes utahensis]